MKKMRKLLLLFFLPLSMIILNACHNNDDEKAKYTSSKIEHLVLFKFRPDISQQERQEVINRFMSLQKSLKNGMPYILSIEYGYQNSKEGVHGDFEIAFRVSFASLEDRDYYVGKPFITEFGKYDQAHDDFKNFVGPYLATNNGVLVFDYEVIK